MAWRQCLMYGSSQGTKEADLGRNAVKGCRDAYLVWPSQQQHSQELQKGRWLGQGLLQHRWTPTCSQVCKAPTCCSRGSTTL